MSWEKKRLSELTTIYSGYAFKSKELSHTSGIPLIKIKNIHNRIVDKEVLTFLPEALFKDKYEKYLLKKGDVLIAMTGQGSVGRIGKTMYVEGTYLVNQRVGIIRANKEKLNSEFLYQCLATKTNESIYFNLAMGAGQPNLSPKDIGGLEMKIPSSLQTQKRIADILSAYDNLIENNLKRIKLLEQAAQNIYKEWFVHLRFPGCENAPIDEETRIPEGWSVLKLGEISNLKYGKMPKANKKNERGYPIYTGYRISGYYQEKMFSDPTLIVVARGVGGTGDVKISPRECWLTNLSIAVINNEESSFQAYLYYFLKSAKLRYLDSGSAQSQITINSLEKVKVTLPSIQLQVIFQKKFDDFSSMTENLKIQNKKLKTARDILLPRLMNRTIEVE
jgi:type I restriction enzyme S subunit